MVMQIGREIFGKSKEEGSLAFAYLKEGLAVESAIDILMEAIDQTSCSFERGELIDHGCRKYLWMS